MPRLVTLVAWAELEFGEAAPPIGTLRRWAREGRFDPPAQRVGNAFFVAPTARYIQPPRANNRLTRGMSLADRISAAERGPLVTGRRRT